MKKQHQSQILDLLKTIENAQSSSMYAECQEAALSICDFIEDVVGEGTVTVELIVEYCELLFKAHNGENVDGLLDEQIVKIENSVRLELKPTCFEIAFISHKVAQSDSIESIYLAAKSDPSCDAYWVSVPYIVHKDGEIPDETHLEALGFYDERFEITDYQKYDIKARRPDAIFTFCPYNLGSGTVTIHPDYYVENLKEATDMLVYVPYHIFIDKVAGDDDARKEFVDKHIVASSHENKDNYNLFATPGSVNADLVITQSENVKQIYQGANRKALGVKTEDDERKLDKFVALGHPKIDKTINSSQEEFVMPKEWLDVIGDRKVILYNSSLVGAGQASSIAVYLQKLLDIISVFSGRKDAVLWWRPHPFLGDILRKTYPEAAQQIKKVMDVFVKSGIGILDETHDLHRAIAWSDAYYGDISSVLYMYAFTGKPALRIEPKTFIAGCNTLGIAKKTNFKEPDVTRGLYWYADCESDTFNLDDFISYVSSDKNTSEVVEKRAKSYREAFTEDGGMAGARIFEYVKNLILN
ncbi:MAG: CDP-glycerol glycerophosphotransferase family protein [Defluviitaleaceae bacterium]|nr:CDP-glycerol glycerophosphotransferase family protein [Defluviitaleaceae bacterium]